MKLTSAAVDDRRRDSRRLNSQLRRIAEEHAVGQAIQRLLREHARQERADRTADAMRSDDVE